MCSLWDCEVTTDNRPERCSLFEEIAYPRPGKLRKIEIWASRLIQASELNTSSATYNVPEELIRETPWGEYGADLPSHDTEASGHVGG